MKQEKCPTCPPVMNVRQILHGGRWRPNSGGASTGPAGRVTPSKQFAAPGESARAKNTQSDAALRPAGAEDSSKRPTLSKMPRIVVVPRAADVSPMRQNPDGATDSSSDRQPQSIRWKKTDDLVGFHDLTGQRFG